MAEDTRYRCHIRTARDHQAGSGVAQAVDIELLSVNVPPLQGAALAPPHPRGNDKLEVCLILLSDRLALPRLALEEEIDVPITGNVLSGNGFPVMSRFG